MLKKKEEKTTEMNHIERRPFYAFQLDWIGQMMASMLWAASVFAYGITSIGDVLQLCAALAWIVANLFSFMNTLSKENLSVDSKKNNG